VSTRFPGGRHAPLLLTFAWLAFTAWVRPLALPDEGRYVGVAWGMLTSGDWIVPRLDGLPYFHKPPLFYWITAASMSVFGPHEWAARLAPWLGACAGAAALYLFARRWCSERVARAGLLALATQPLVFIGGQFANLDMLVAGCIAVSVFGFAHAVLADALPADRRRGLTAGYAFAALAVLAKGLIGIVLPGLVLVVWLVGRRQWRLLRRLFWLPGMLLFALVAGPWFVVMQLRFPEFAHYFFVVQHFSRFAQGGFNNQQPAYFYLVVVAVLALPWTGWLAATVRGDAHLDAPGRAIRQLLWIWLIAITVFFSLPQSKLVGYILPVSWPLALLVAQRFGEARRPTSPQVARLWRASAAIALAGCVGLIVASTVLPRKSGRATGVALRAVLADGDRVVLLHEYDFDLPFYARLRHPVVVVEDWTGELARLDSWRKELADAGRFDPVRARAVELAPAEWQTVLCDGRTTWVIGTPAAASRYPVMKEAQVVAVAPDRTLWKLPAQAPGVLTAAGCGRTPSANSGGRS
jgi:4-amino-4-deoxy-L-arabinose transferase-like glycosyltransferase